MFTRARLRLTALYAGLFALGLIAVAVALAVNSVREARRSADAELQLRAQDIAGHVRRGDTLPQGGQQPDSDDTNIEGRGILAYVLPVTNGRCDAPAPDATTHLPDAALAQTALTGGAGRFATLEGSARDLRLYSLPVQQNGATVAVVQVARSQYFVDETVPRLWLTTLIVGGLALLAAAGAGFWLAGRTLQPIAAALERQRSFTADASHELRTPLAVLLGNAEYLARHQQETIGAHADVVEDMLAESRRLSELVAGLLTLARADEGRLELRREEVDLGSVAADAARSLRPLAEAKGLELTASAAGEVRVQADRDRIYQLALILIDNAVRYTAHGSVHVTVSAWDGEALLRVADSGQGIAPEHLPHLFERFYRPDESRGSDGGAGLGLAIADWIVRAHEGRIDVESTPDAGSVFTVHLPLIARRHVPRLRR
jgi:signal transduction histidine kinase